MEQTSWKKSPSEPAEFLEGLIQNSHIHREDLSMGKQLLLYTENPFLVKNVTKYSMEAQRISHRVNALSLQTELIELQENSSLQDACCDPVTFWTKKVSAEDACCLQKTNLHTLTAFCPNLPLCVSVFSTMSTVKNSYYSSLISEHSHQCLLLDITQFESKKGVVTSSSIKTEMLLQNNVLARNWFSLYSLTYSYHHHHYIWSTFTTSVMCWKFGFRPLILWVGVRNFSLKMSNFQLTRYRTAKVNKKTADCDK